jgi:hypothetical protein
MLNRLPTSGEQALHPAVAHLKGLGLRGEFIP